MKALLTPQSLRLLPLFFAFTIAQGLMADTHNWLGGDGDWGDPTNWDLGSVPQSDDEAIILTPGIVSIHNAENFAAVKVVVGTDCELHLFKGGQLTIEDASGVAGLTNNGTVRLYGLLQLANLYVGGSPLYGGKAIVNRGLFHVYDSGKIDTYDIEGAGIWNFGTFINQGVIGLQEVQEHGIINDGDFYNAHNILTRITNAGNFSSIYNTDNFRNLSDALLILQDGHHGLENEINGRFYNYGELIIYNADEYGIINRNYFYNLNNSLLIIKNSGLYGVANGSRFYNFSELYITNSIENGFSNTDFLYNTGNIEIYDSGLTGLVTWPSGLYYNRGSLVVRNAQWQGAIFIHGNAINLNSGTIDVDHRIGIPNGGMMTNYGHMKVEVQGNIAIIDGELFTNEGIVESVNGTGISFLATNNQIVFKAFPDLCKMESLFLMHSKSAVVITLEL